MASQDYRLYVGTYTQGDREGIYVYNYNAADGTMERVQAVGGVRNPSYLAVHPGKDHLYSVSELSGNGGGGACAFSVERPSGKLTQLNQQPTHGGSPCYISVDKTGKWALTANYSGGNVTVFPIGEGGRLESPSMVLQHGGSGPNERRQQGPHPHCVILDESNRYAFVPDLGIDRIMIYRFDAEIGVIRANDPSHVKTEPGAGPRHITFHPNGRLAFSIQELGCTLSSYEYDPETGTLRTLQTVPALPPGFEGENTCADIHVSPDGKFVYGSNRGHDSIVAYGIIEQTGVMEYVGHYSTQGETPRNFAIDPEGNHLLAANQRTNNVVVFKIDKQSGALEASGTVEEIPSPVCLKFMKP